MYHWEEYKIYKLYGGMTGEFEVLKTDAPREVVIEYIIAASDLTLPDDDPELFFEQKGYQVEFLWSQNDDLDDEVVDKVVDEEIDTYDYIRSYIIIPEDEFKANLDEYLETVKSDDIVITRNGKHIARLTRPEGLA